MRTIGNSKSYTKKQAKIWGIEWALCKTKKEKTKWLSEGECDAIMLTNIETMEHHWYPMINGLRLADGDKIDKYDSYEDAYVAATKFKKEYVIKSKKLKNANI
jgi:hypothetical protein